MRWHVAQTLPRLTLSKKQQQHVVAILSDDYMGDASSIVKVNTLQALAELVVHNKSLLNPVRFLLEQALFEGTPAMAARSKKLLRLLKTYDQTK